MTAQFEWIVGAEVVDSLEYERPVRCITKVYKNGNFVLERSDQQYQCSPYNDVAWETGRRNGYVSAVHLFHDGNREILADNIRRAKCRRNNLKLADLLTDLKITDFDADISALIAKIEDRKS